MKLQSISSWLNVKKPLIISGPCSAETEEQTVATAKQIAATGKVHALRAGIWKPRTRPGQYEGAGDVGLQWLMARASTRSEEHTSELQSRFDLVCRLLLEKKKQIKYYKGR